ncbi:hypothetical protein [Nonomuraea fuscirosea]|uniref:hypothetical protein n=1 Tax=Nonomuraea fuscirosea TaxID=1291556 RepID=UPI0034179227
MLWVIEGQPDTTYDGKETLPETQQADIGHLESNGAVKPHVKNREVSYSKDQAGTRYAKNLEKGEPIYVLTHAGIARSGPWIGGMDFPTFADKMVRKFGKQLDGRTVYVLACFIGEKAYKLAEALAENGADNVRLYVPNKLMYISTAGIPHVLNSDQSFEEGNEYVAKNANQHQRMKLSLPCGKQWSGARAADGTATIITAGEAEKAVIGHFDPSRIET